MQVDGLDNDDWEDLSSFADAGQSFLVIAAIGDNDAERHYRSFYFVAEPPATHDGNVAVARRLDYRYPDGPRDAESAAIDPAAREVLVLTKRDIPPRLYSVPLDTGDDLSEARFLGTVDGLPRPTAVDIAAAPGAKDWWWQPVGMDIAADGRAAVVLTYRGVYFFERRRGASWLDALNGTPRIAPLGDFKNAEAVTFAGGGYRVVVTGENENSAMLSIDFGGDTR